MALDFWPHERMDLFSAHGNETMVIVDEVQVAQEV